MNLNEFRQRIEANQPSTEDGIEWVVALTVAEAQWLLEGVEKDRTALKLVHWEVDIRQDGERIHRCQWCANPDTLPCTPDCPRQIALKHWEDEP